MRCEGDERDIYIGQKYRVIGHIMKTHLTLTDVPYYCSRCLFRCQQWNDLIKHVRHFRPHQIQRGRVIASGDGQERKYIGKLTNLLSSWWKSPMLSLDE